jgi:hypothetical protein
MKNRFIDREEGLIEDCPFIGVRPLNCSRLYSPVSRLLTPGRQLLMELIADIRKPGREDRNVKTFPTARKMLELAKD